MKLAATLATASLLGACTYRHQPYTLCMTGIDSSQQAWAEAIAAADRRPDAVATRFKLCGNSRTIPAFEAALADLRSEGYSAERSRYEEVDHCWNVEREVGPSAAALRSEVDQMCRIADTSGGVFIGWSATIGGHFLIGQGAQVSLDGRRRSGERSD